jgi:hypothetical protein
MNDKVIFRVTPDEPREVIAFLPDGLANPNNILCYMHVGQHSEAMLEYFNTCTPAMPDQYADLQAELESLGYVLDVLLMPIRKQ